MAEVARPLRRILRLPEVLERTGLGRTSVYKLMGSGEFPRPRKLTSSANGWLESEIQDWIDSRPVNDEVGPGVSGGR